VRAARLWLLKRLDALRKRAEQMGADVLEVESAGGSYVLQKGRCGSAMAGGQLHVIGRRFEPLSQ